MIPSFEDYRATMNAQGYDEVLVRDWKPRQVVDEHSHPFDAKAVVVAGEMFLTVDGQTRRLLPGDGFELVRGEPHSERYGEEGATYWVGRRG